jgi:hypothetical protein
MDSGRFPVPLLPFSVQVFPKVVNSLEQITTLALIWQVQSNQAVQKSTIHGTGDGANNGWWVLVDLWQLGTYVDIRAKFVHTTILI